MTSVTTSPEHGSSGQTDERADLERIWQTHVDALRALLTVEQPFGLDAAALADAGKFWLAQFASFQALVARDQHIANVKGALLGLSLVTMAQGIAEGWINGVDTTVDTLNQLLAQHGLSWRLIRPN